MNCITESAPVIRQRPTVRAVWTFPMHALLLVVSAIGCDARSTETPLLTQASEDVSHLLETPELASGEVDIDAPRDYLPDPRTDWVVTFEFAETQTPEQIESALSIKWQTEHGVPTIYGFAPEDGHWTFVFAADAPESFDKLKLAWSLWDGIAERPATVSDDELQSHRQSASEALKAIGNVEVTTERPADEALAEVAALMELVSNCSQDVTIWLRVADGEKFSGREVWDVLLCLGLDYGDGDLFHWINNSGFGDDLFFTVQTSTPPGYFISERMASGEGDVDDLMFNFSIPRSADPVAVFDSTLRAVKYAQSRLGGSIVADSGEPFDEDAERVKIKAIVEELRNAGFVPGESSTCRVF